MSGFHSLFSANIHFSVLYTFFFFIFTISFKASVKPFHSKNVQNPAEIFVKNDIKKIAATGPNFSSHLAY